MEVNLVSSAIRRFKAMQKRDLFAQQVTLGTSNLKFSSLIQFFFKNKKHKSYAKRWGSMKSKESEKEKSKHLIAWAKLKIKSEK